MTLLKRLQPIHHHHQFHFLSLKPQTLCYFKTVKLITINKLNFKRFADGRPKILFRDKTINLDLVKMEKEVILMVIMAKYFTVIHQINHNFSLDFNNVAFIIFTLLFINLGLQIRQILHFTQQYFSNLNFLFINLHFSHYFRE